MRYILRSVIFVIMNQGSKMGSYVEPNRQLILELYSKDLNRSIEFYTQFGFKVIRKDEGFVELSWGENFLYLEESHPSEGIKPPAPSGNIRIMVPDVDNYWELAQKLRTKVLRKIGDRDYGLRDFTIYGPDGIGLRFATRITTL